MSLADWVMQRLEHLALGEGLPGLDGDARLVVVQLGLVFGGVGRLSR